MGFEGFETSFSPSFKPLTDRCFTHAQGYRDVLWLPALLFELPGLHSSFFSPIGFFWCSHTSYLLIFYFLLPRSVNTVENLLCVVFLFDFFRSLRLAPNKREYFLKGGGWLDLLG